MKLTKAYVKHVHGGDTFFINKSDYIIGICSTVKLPFIVAYSYDFGEDGKTMAVGKDKIVINLNNVIYIQWYENNTVEVEDSALCSERLKNDKT